MRILLYSDVHFSTYSSILRLRGKKFSVRLENLIKSLSWAESLSDQEHCDMVVTLGDFFDKSVVSDEEMTALREVVWNTKIPHYTLVGNHESSISSLEYSSAHALASGATPFYVISQPYKLSIKGGALYFIPYVMEDNRKPLQEYLTELGYQKQDLNVVLSHNDLKGIQLGRIQSAVGFELADIESCCDLFINGHIHNSNWITKKILNLGNLTGMNFGEDAFVYKHQVMILDTETREVQLIENPYSLKFYQLTIEKKSDLARFRKLEPNAVVSIRCKESFYEDVLAELRANTNILEHRVSILKESGETQETQASVETLHVDHLQKFKEFVLSKLGDDLVVQEELTSLGVQ